MYQLTYQKHMVSGLLAGLVLPTSYVCPDAVSVKLREARLLDITEDCPERDMAGNTFFVSDVQVTLNE